MCHGKFFLQASNWPYNTSNKDETYHLFHHHGDAFLRMYSEVPQQLTVTPDPTTPVGATTVTAQPDEGAATALATLPDDTRVVCGHGPDTWIGREKASNPFVRAV